MNGNSSKQVLLSVLGIAVLVVAVVGVSFAFFTYSRQGTTDNVITTGSIVFSYLDQHGIILSNQFPVTDAVGQTLSTVGSQTGTKTLVAGDNPVMDFSVTGYDGSGKGISYTITAREGEVQYVDPNAPENQRVEKTRLLDNEVKLLLTDVDSHATLNNFSSPKVVGAPGSLANGVVLGTGRITATTQASPQTDHYTLRMWIAAYDSSTQTGCQVVSGDGASNDPATHTYTSTTFAGLYYSLRVDVSANTTPAS